MAVALNAALFSISPAIYVDGQSGLDTNAGTTPELPLKTLIEAEQRAAALVFDVDVQIIVLTAGTYTMPGWRPRIYRTGQLYVRALPVTILRASTAALAGSSTTIIKTTGLTTDQYSDEFIHVLTGAAAGDYRMVKNGPNSTDLIPVRPFTAAIAAGDLYEIVRPSVILDCSLSKPMIGTPLGIGGNVALFFPTLNFENFLFTGFPSCVGRVAFWRCRLVGSVLQNTNPSATAFFAGFDGLSLPPLVIGAFGPQRVYGGAVAAYYGAGIASNGIEETDLGGVQGYVNSEQGATIRIAPFTQIMGGYIRGDHITVIGPNVSVLLGSSDSGQLLLQDGQNTATLRVRQRGHCSLLRVLVNGLGTIGMSAESGGSIDITAAASAVQIVGANYGIQAYNGAGQVFLNEAAPSVTASIAKYAAGGVLGAPGATSNSLPNIGDTLVPSPNDGSRITRVS